MILAPSCSRLCCAARSIWFRTIRPNNALSSSKRGTNGPRETTSSRTSASGTATCARCATPCKSLRIVCGITGILAYGAHAPAVDYGELMRTRDAMSSRGPDGAGAWLTGDRRLGLAHRRLAIIDLTEAGAQPMHSADGRFIVTFNGEIYNYPQLRTQFEREGAVLRAQSDTEILLHLYRKHGSAMVDELRGMYAFAIWDAQAQRLFLARDPHGIKPLYYADDGGTFRFASQVSALRAGGGIDSRPDPAGTVGFLLWGSVPEPFTLYRSVRLLPAGSTMEVSWRGASPLVAIGPFPKRCKTRRSSRPLYPLAANAISCARAFSRASVRIFSRMCELEPSYLLGSTHRRWSAWLVKPARRACRP